MVAKNDTLRYRSYPYEDLHKSINRARVIYKSLGRNPKNKNDLADRWGLKVTSSTFRCVLAALRAFGLLDEVVGREEPLVKLSERALDIVADHREGDPQWHLAIRDAALAPKLHADLWEQYKAKLPNDIEIRRYLVRGRNFNDRTVDTFIQEYKSTLEFAGLIGAGKVDGESAVGAPGHRVSQGADQSPEPRSVDRLGEDGLDACVEVIMPNPPAHQPAAGQPLVNGVVEAPVSPGVIDVVYPLGEGRKLVLQMPERFSASSYEVFGDLLNLILRTAWESIDETASGAPKPPRPTKL